MATLMTTTAPTSTARPERAARTISPRVDIYETDKAFVLLADMPGVGAGGLDVVTEGDSSSSTDASSVRPARPTTRSSSWATTTGRLPSPRIWTPTASAPRSGTGCCESRSPSLRVCSPRRSPCAPSEPGEPVMSIMDKVGALLPWRGQRRNLPPTPDEGQALLDDVDRWLKRLVAEPQGLPMPAPFGGGAVRRRAGE